MSVLGVVMLTWSLLSSVTSDAPTCPSFEARGSVSGEAELD